VKIHPEWMEAKLVAHGVVKEGEFYISSQLDPRFGESPVIVVLKQVAPGDVATFLKELNGVLNKHEFLKAVVIFDKFEYTGNGKLKRLKFE
jgi:hypothetical protein